MYINMYISVVVYITMYVAYIFHFKLKCYFWKLSMPTKIATNQPPQNIYIGLAMASPFTDKVTATYAGVKCFNALKIDNSSLINGYNDISTKSQYLCHNYFTFQIMLDSIPMTIFGQNYIAVNPRKSRHLTLSKKPLPEWCRVTILAGGRVVRDTKPYFTDRSSFLFVIN